MSSSINWNELIANAISELKIANDNLNNAETIDKIKKHIENNGNVTKKDITKFRNAFKSYTQNLLKSEKSAKSEKSDKPAKKEVKKKDLEAAGNKSESSNSTKLSSKQTSEEGFNLTTTSNTLTDGNLLIENNIFNSNAKPTKNCMSIVKLKSEDGLQLLLSEEDLQKYTDLYINAINELNDLIDEIKQQSEDIDDDDDHRTTIKCKSLTSGNKVIWLKFGNMKKEMLIDSDRCTKLIELFTFIDNPKLKSVCKDEQYLDYLKSKIVKSFNILHPNIANKALQTKSPYIYIKALEYIDDDEADVNEKEIEKAASKNKFDVDYYMLFKCIQNFGCKNFIKTSKLIFKYRLGIINKYNLNKEFALDKLWNKAYANLKQLRDSKEFNEKLKSELSGKDDILNNINNHIDAWLNILESKIAFYIIMKGARSNKLFEKYLTMLAGSNISMRLLLGPLYPISFIFTPFMLWKDSASFKSKDSVKTIFNDFQDDASVDINELNWIYYLKHPNCDENDMVKTLEKFILNMNILEQERGSKPPNTTTKKTVEKPLRERKVVTKPTTNTKSKVTKPKTKSKNDDDDFDDVDEKAIDNNELLNDESADNSDNDLDDDFNDDDNDQDDDFDESD